MFLEQIKNKILGKKKTDDPVSNYRGALFWLQNHVVDDMAPVSDRIMEPYPEVTGYLIPTLMNCGWHDLALKYARSLIRAQNDDGSWADISRTPYVFDTAQAIRGLLEVRTRINTDAADKAITDGCNYICRNALPSGRVVQPDTRNWKNQDGSLIPEWIHLYCIEPLDRASRQYRSFRYHEVAKGVLDYYKPRVDYDALDHFRAYAEDGMHYCNALPGMERPEPKPVQTVPGTFQESIIAHYRGNDQLSWHLFQLAENYQRYTGGFYGDISTGWYFPKEEISWAVKFYLDAFLTQMEIAFSRSEGIPDTISRTDPRYAALEKELPDAGIILDAGCGKGRYAVNAVTAQRRIVCMDMTDEFMRGIPLSFERKTGSLHNIPYPDNYFDAVYCIEALEHALEPYVALKELVRVTKPGGTVLVLDKNHNYWGRMETAPWEHWYNRGHLEALLSHAGCSEVTAIDVPWGSDPDFFLLWKGIKRS